MAKLNKAERRALVKQQQAAERADLEESMPLSPEQLNSLLDYLDANLKSCDRTTRLTETFLATEQLAKDRVLPWLGDHGGYCDCEVLCNLDDLAESFRERPVPPIPEPKKTKRTPRDLTSVTGWDFKELPQPWRVANLYAADEPLRIQMGKKGGCTIEVIESALPPGDRLADDYWTALWYERTELPQKSAIHVTRPALNLPDRFQSILLESPGWTPVHCWITSDDAEWSLEVRTESNRQQGDLAQVADLITHLSNNAE